VCMNSLIILALSLSHVVFSGDIDLRRDDPIYLGIQGTLYSEVNNYLWDMYREDALMRYNVGDIGEGELSRRLSPSSPSNSQSPSPILPFYGFNRKVLLVGNTYCLYDCTLFSLYNDLRIKPKYPSIVITNKGPSVALLYEGGIPGGALKRGLTITFRPGASVSSNPPFLNLVSFDVIIFYYRGSYRVLSLIGSASYKLKDNDARASISLQLLNW